MQSIIESDSSRSDILLNKSAVAWFLVAACGMWLFVFYIVALYYRAAIQGNFEGWNLVMAHGYEAGNTTGNMFLGAHLFFAAIITFSGTLQLIPQIRKHIPLFHRWNGRLFILAAFIMGTSGLYLTLADRRQVGGEPGLNAYSIIINAILIIIFAVVALRYAMTGRFDIHRRWALRLFLVVNGVWFFRIGLMLWVFLTGGIGIEWKTFSGPFIKSMGFGQFLLPLTMLELYFLSKKWRSLVGKYAMGVVLILLTVLTALGILNAFMGMWLPRIIH